MKLTEAKLKELIEEALSESKKGQQHQHVERPWVDHIVPLMKYAFEDVEVEVVRGRISKLVLIPENTADNLNVEIVWDRYEFAVQVQNQGGSDSTKLSMINFKTMDDFTKAIFDAAEKLVKKWR